MGVVGYSDDFLGDEPPSYSDAWGPVLLSKRDRLSQQAADGFVSWIEDTLRYGSSLSLVSLFPFSTRKRENRISWDEGKVEEQLPSGGCPRGGGISTT